MTAAQWALYSHVPLLRSPPSSDRFNLVGPNEKGEAKIAIRSAFERRLALATRMGASKEEALGVSECVWAVRRAFIFERPFYNGQARFEGLGRRIHS